MKTKMTIMIAALLFVGSPCFAATSTLTEELEVPKTRNINVRVEPLKFLYGIANLNVNYFVTPSMSIGVTGLSLVDDSALKDALEDNVFEDYSFDASEYGLRFDYGFGANGLQGNSFYVSPKLSLMTVNVKDNIFNREATGDFTLVTAVAGYQWMWSNFNMNLEAGVSTAVSEEIKVENGGNVSRDDVEKLGTLPVIAFGLGFAF